MNIRKLDQFMLKRGGSVDPKKFKDEIFELLSIPAFDKGVPEIIKGEEVGSTKKIVEPNDVLLSKIVPHIRRCWVVPVADTYRQIASGEWIQFRSREFVPDYVRHFLTSDHFHSQFMKTVTGIGGSLLRARPAEVANIKIPLPPLDDQKRIAHLLGKVEGLIARRKQHLQHLDDLLKSVFLEMFGDPVRNEKNHNISTIAPYITHLTSGGRGWAKYYSESGKRFIRSLDVQMNAIGSDDIVYVTPPNNKETERTRVIPGDVLLTITGSKIGRVCSVPQDFEESYISQHVAIIRTKGINPVYLSFYLSMPACGQRTIAKQQYGQAKPGLNLAQIQNFEIIDPDIDLQNQFAAIAEKVEALKSRYQQSLNDLESLYGTLSQKAFKGELDLSRIPLGREKQEMHEEGHEEATTSFESVFPKHIEATLESLNSFNQSASSLKAAQEEAVRFSKLDLPQLNAVRRATEQLAALHTPLHEMKQMAGISKAMEQAQAAIKSMGIENLESISKTAELARTIAINIPKIDLGWLEQQKDLLRNATEPFESMRKVMESISWPSKSLQESIRLQSETAKRLSSSIPDFISWQKQAFDLDAVEFEDEDGAAKRLFTQEDVTDIFAYAIEPLSFDSLLHELGELETVDFAGYETIKTSLFDLLDEKQLTQLFDNEMKLLLFSSSEKGPFQ